MVVLMTPCVFFFGRSHQVAPETWGRKSFLVFLYCVVLVYFLSCYNSKHCSGCNRELPAGGSDGQVAAV